MTDSPFSRQIKSLIFWSAKLDSQKFLNFLLPSIEVELYMIWLFSLVKDVVFIIVNPFSESPPVLPEFLSQTARFPPAGSANPEYHLHKWSWSRWRVLRTD